MDSSLIQVIQALCELPGVSGGEDMVRAEILSHIGGAVQVKVDPLGNILAFKEGRARPKNKLLLSAHMDEVGFVVTHVEDSGLLRFSAVGGIDSRVVIGKAVEIGPQRVYGLIGSKAVHLQEEKERAEPQKPDKLFIDVGATDKESAQSLVRPGDRAVFHSVFTQFGNGHLMSRALDDRVGCGLLLALLDTELEYDCHFAFTVQEETGCTGAHAAAYTVDPDISLVLETTTASDIPGVEDAKVVCRLGGGPVLSFMDRGTIYDSALYARALETASAASIPCQSKEGIFGGNESRSIQTSRDGVRTLAISLPCRYLHSPACVAQRSDIVDTLRLVEAFLPVAAQL